MKLFISILLFSLIAVSSNAQKLSFRENVVAEYLFNGNADDSSSQSNNGIVTGAKLKVNRFGRANSSFQFDGVDDVINVGNVWRGSEFSLSVWVNVQSKSSEFYGQLIEHDNHNNCHGVGLKVTPNEEKFMFSLCDTTGSTNNLVSGFNIKRNKWTHVVVTYHLDTARMYINGKFDSRMNIEAALPPKGRDWTIGNGFDQNTKHPFKGFIDDVYIIDKAINQCEVIELYNRGKSPSDADYIQPCLQRNQIAKGAVTVNSETVTIKMWDDVKEDGDIVSVYLNDVRIQKKVTVKKSGHTFTVELNQGVNIFKLLAHNEGSIPPNTAAILIDDGIELQRRVLSSKKDEFATLRILLD